MTQTIAQEMLSLAASLTNITAQHRLSYLASKVARLERTLDEIMRDAIEDSNLTFEAVRDGKVVPFLGGKHFRRPEFRDDTEAQLRFVESVMDGSAPRGDGAA